LAAEAATGKVNWRWLIFKKKKEPLGEALRMIE